MKLALILVAMSFGLSACGKGDSSSATATSSESSGKMIEFVTTQDSKPLVIDPALFDTPAAKEFMTTGKNPYIGNAEAIAKGKKVFQLYSCTQCHGPEAKGQVGPGLVGPDYKYPKDVTNKGMFETVWHGTNGDSIGGPQPETVEVQTLRIDVPIGSTSAVLPGDDSAVSPVADDHGRVLIVACLT